MKKNHQCDCCCHGGSDFYFCFHPKSEPGLIGVVVVCAVQRNWTTEAAVKTTLTEKSLMTPLPQPALSPKPPKT